MLWKPQSAASAAGCNTSRATPAMSYVLGQAALHGPRARPRPRVMLATGGLLLGVRVFGAMQTGCHCGSDLTLLAGMAAAVARMLLSLAER